MTPRDYFTIGEVVQKLKSSYPDLSVSKVRFLEEAGLIKPFRTPSGYRKYSRDDIERLEIILRLQSEFFFPHTVIKEKLEDMDAGIPIKELQDKLQEATDADNNGNGEPLSYTKISQKFGINVKYLGRLEEYGLLESKTERNEKHISSDSLGFVQSADALSAFGFEPRHLKRYFFNAANSATDEFYTLLSQTYRYKTPESRTQLREKIDEISKHSLEIYSHQFKKLLMDKLEDFI